MGYSDGFLHVKFTDALMMIDRLRGVVGDRTIGYSDLVQHCIAGLACGNFIYQGYQEFINPRNWPAIVDEQLPSDELPEDKAEDGAN
jgi:hypothetical protein